MASTRRRVVPMPLSPAPGPAASAMMETPRELCPRCSKHHRGTSICVTTVTRSDALALGWHRIDIDDTGRRGGDGRRCKLVAALQDVLPSRARAIAKCSRVHGALVDGKPMMIQLRCRDRACPVCARIRAADLGRELAEEIHARARAGIVMWSACFSQRKPKDDDPAIALRSIRESWSKLWGVQRALGRTVRSRHRGVFRVIEVTWSEKGAPRKHGGTVPYSGWHAHIHAIVEGGTERDVRRTMWDWCALTGASRQAHDERAVARVTGSYAQELAAYDMKALSGVPDERVAPLYLALKGVRLHQGLGSWRSWKPPKEPSDCTVLISRQTIGELWEQKRDGLSWLVTVSKPGGADAEFVDLRDFFADTLEMVGHESKASTRLVSS